MSIITEDQDKTEQLVSKDLKQCPETEIVKKSDEGDAKLDVHSANSWETADLGDSKRNDKFLRLMGAGKKEHHGRFVIGDKSPVQTRPKNDSKHLNEDLADQYEQSMGHRLASGPRGHLGLGFHPDDGGEQKQPTADTNNDSNSRDDSNGDSGQDNSTDGDDDSNKAKEDDSSRKAVERKRESSGGDSSGPEEKKMKFVKSSS